MQYLNAEEAEAVAETLKSLDSLRFLVDDGFIFTASKDRIVLKSADREVSEFKIVNEEWVAVPLHQSPLFNE